jgi:hypothetical protein
MRALSVLVAALLLSAHAGAAEPRFRSLLSTARSQMEKAPRLAERLKVFSRLKRELLLEAAPARARRLPTLARSSLHGLNAHLEPIPAHGFARERCDEYRDSIIFGFSPSLENPEVPDEAAQALELLALLCAAG